MLFKFVLCEICQNYLKYQEVRRGRNRPGGKIHDAITHFVGSSSEMFHCTFRRPFCVDGHLKTAYWNSFQEIDWAHHFCVLSFLFFFISFYLQAEKYASICNGGDGITSSASHKMDVDVNLYLCAGASR